MQLMLTTTKNWCKTKNYSNCKPMNSVCGSARSTQLRFRTQSVKPSLRPLGCNRGSTLTPLDCRTRGTLAFAARSNKESSRQAKTFAAATPDVRPDSDSKDPSQSSPPVEAKQQEQPKEAKPKAAKVTKKAKEKKEPWPLSRNTNPVSTTGRTHYNIIKRSQWPTGVPSVMGGHVMPSGEVAPVTQSKNTISDIYAKEETQYVHPFHYYEEGMPAERGIVSVYPSKNALGESLVSDVISTANEAIKATGKFTIALSGGSLLNMLENLGADQVDWAKVHVFWVDERLAPLDSEDSNAGAAKKIFLDKLNIPESQHHVIDASLPVDQAAKAYEGRMLALSSEVLPRNEGGIPVLDMVLLGMGPDGHVASLFPNRKELAENPTSWILPVQNSPKPPSERITMTLDILNAASKVVLVAAGKGKAEIVQRVLEVQSLPGAMPAQLVRPTTGSLAWYLDVDSASDISPSTWEDKKAFPRNKM